MKKCFFCWMLICFLAAGCGRLPLSSFTPAQTASLGFTLRTGEAAIEGTLQCNSFEDIRLRFTSPAALTYCTAVFSGETLQMDIAGVADTVETAELPTFAPALLLCETLRRALYERQDFTREADGNYLAVLPYGGRAVRCRFTPAGAILQIACEAEGITIDFYE